MTEIVWVLWHSCVVGLAAAAGAWLGSRKAGRAAERLAEQNEEDARHAGVVRTNRLRDQGRWRSRRAEHDGEQPSRNGRMRVYGTSALPGDKPVTRN